MAHLQAQRRAHRSPVRRNTHATGVESLESRRLFALQQSGFVDEMVGAGISNATTMEFAPDGRLFVSQETGQLRVVKNGVLNATPFVSLTVDSNGERGLLGIAFDPNYATNRYVYVYYTVPAPSGGSAHNRVSRFTADASNPDIAVAGSELPILDLDNLSTATNHNGGAIHFGPDGKLYVAVGENANRTNAQTLSNRLGKMLRINSDGSIPTDNPFYTTATGANRSIWALGLRNPFTFAFDTDGTMYINDVGENTWEEINIGQAGANYGWPVEEGPEATPDPAYADPFFYYNHTGTDADATGNVIAGGAFYRRSASAANPFPDSYVGDYFYADSGHGWIRSLDDNTTNSTLLLNNAAGIVDLKVGPDGSLYYLTRGSGSGVHRVRYTVTPPTVPDLATASDTGVSTTDNITKNNTLTFTGTAIGSSTVTIFADGAAVGSAVATTAGAYSVTTSALTEGTHQITSSATSAGNASAKSAALSVVVDRTAPTVTNPTFSYLTAQRIRYIFSEDVRPSIDVSDLQALNESTDQFEPSSFFTVNTGGGSGTPYFAEFVSKTLPDGYYEWTLLAAGVTDIAGNALSGGASIGDFVYSGDANHNRTANFDDLVALAQNYNKPGDFSKGDFNYDGIVNFDDLVILAQKYNQTLPLLPQPQLTVTPAKTKKRERLIVE